MTSMNRPNDRITDNRVKFHLRWKDHCETLPPPEPPPYPCYEPLPRLEPAGCILTAFFTFLVLAAAIFTYHLHTYPITP